MMVLGALLGLLAGCGAGYKTYDNNEAPDDDTDGDDDTGDDDTGDDDTAAPDDDDAVATAEAFLDQPPSRWNILYADADCDWCPTGKQTVADNFSLAQSTTVTRAVIWIAYIPDDIPLADDDWTVIIHEGTASEPGAAVYTAEDVPSSKVLTGADLFGYDEYEVELVFDPPAELAAGTHWIEIFNNSAGSDQSVVWGEGDPDPLGHGLEGTVADDQHVPGTAWEFSDSVDDFALTLYGGQ